MNSRNGAVIKASEKALGALLGAAIGDALGWPNEMPARRVRAGDGGDSIPASGFETWRRRSGGRFLPHEEVIRAGEYSDDTQLLLCSARSLLHGPLWFDHLVSKELPAWRLYQRGGGGATNRAVDMWAKGQSPWSLDADDPKKMRYFDAGGNGVAMRILAHAIVGNHDETFRPTAKAILLNGIATHGHPRALIGALAYGFTVWQALRLSGTLGYGQLIELTLNHSDDWAFFPQQNALLSQWQEETQKVHQGRFDQLWTTTKSEILALFEIALAGIRAGAISVDSRVLSELGCFNRAVNGSGTVCAAASIFLASKYAPDPQNGLIQAASSRGADTDTIASMAGALLGVIAGIEWLQRYRNQVQDEQYLTELAQRLESSGFDQGSIDPIGEPTAKPIAAMDRFLESLRKGASGDILELPDGRKALIKEVALLETRSQSLRGKQWKLRTEDGQSLYIKKLERESKIEGLGQATRESDFKVRANTESIRPGIKIKAVKLIVRDLERSRWFYHKVLGLKVYRESKSLVNFGGVISLISLEHRGEFESAFEEGFQTKSILCLESVNIQACHDRVRSFIEAQPTPIYDRAGRRAFRCTDLDGNVIEVYESLRKKLPALGPRP